VKKTLLLVAATLLALSATIPQAAADGGNPLCPPGKTCTVR